MNLLNIFKFKKSNPVNRYDAATPSLDRSLNNDPLEPSDNSTEAMDRIQLMREARNLYKNFPVCRYLERQLRRNCTPTGWRANTGDADMDSAINEYIEIMMEADNFDYAQSMDAPTMFGASIVDRGVDGDFFLYNVRPRGERSSYAQSIRADLIGNKTRPNDRNYLPGKKEESARTVSGVVVDSRGRRVRYEKYKPESGRGSGSSSYVFDRNLKARAVLHFYDPEHTDSVRGITHWSSAVTDLKDLKDIFGFEKSNQKFSASVAGVVKNEKGKANPNATTTRRMDLAANTTSAQSIKETAPTVSKVNGLTLHHLNLNESLEQFASNRPGATFMQFAEYLRSSGALSLDLPYGVTVDSKELNGGALRLELSKADGAFKESRRLLENRLMNPWLRMKLVEGAANGMIPNLRPAQALRVKGSWSYPPSVTADEKYSSDVLHKSIDAGLLSREDACQLRGQSFKDVLNEKEIEAEMIFEKAKALHEKVGGDESGLTLGYFIEAIGGSSVTNPNGVTPFQVLDQPSQVPVAEEE